jgi:hypothetical protein
LDRFVDGNAGIEVPRPELVEAPAAGSTQPVLKAQVGVTAVSGKHRTTAWLADSGFVSVGYDPLEDGTGMTTSAASSGGSRPHPTGSRVYYAVSHYTQRPPATTDRVTPGRLQGKHLTTLTTEPLPQEALTDEPGVSVGFLQKAQ